MTKNLFTLLFCLLAFNSFSQSDSLFKGIYVKEGFEKYKGNITVSGDTVHYDSVSLRIVTELPELSKVFTDGIFYPGILAGERSGKPEMVKSINNIWTTIAINVFNIKPVTKSFTRKRIRIWVWSKGLANPTEYVFDIENDKATATTDLATFVKDAKVTYIQYVTVII